MAIQDRAIDERYVADGVADGELVASACAAHRFGLDQIFRALQSAALDGKLA